MTSTPAAVPETSATPEAASAPAPESPWAPLRVPAFRMLWIATVASNVGTWMHDTAASWLMTSLTASTLAVALMQTASSLPTLFLALPAGALADVVDRRRLLIVTQSWMLGAASLLGLLTITHLIRPTSLLVLTFVLGLGIALNTPAWQAIFADLVPRAQLPAAVSLNGIATNIARAVGPAVGGLLVAAFGSGWVFLLNALSFVAVVGALVRWRPPPAHASALPAERVLGAVGAGVRYARFSPAVQTAMLRTSAFIAGASALWALLPVVARRQLGLHAEGYGLLLGSIGVGAIAGGAFLPRFRHRLTTDQLVLAATFAYALSTVALALVRPLVLLCPALAVAGLAWMTAMPLFNVATQRAAPDWARARTLAVYVLAFQGGMAVGGALWGTIADRFGVRVALLGAAALLPAAGLAAFGRARLADYEGLDLRPSRHWEAPVVESEVPHEAGPVLVTVEYRVRLEDAEAFARAMDGVHALRRRDGAIAWGLYRDTSDATRYVETFVSDSWGEHLRQHARATVADRAVEAAARAFQVGGPPVVTHLVDVASLHGDRR